MFLLAVSQRLTKGLVGWRSLPGQRPCEATASLCKLANAAVLGRAGAMGAFPGDVASFGGASGKAGLWQGSGLCLMGRGDPALFCTPEASSALKLLPGACFGPWQLVEQAGRTHPVPALRATAGSCSVELGSTGGKRQQRVLWPLAVSIAVALLGELWSCFSSVVTQKRCYPGLLHEGLCWGPSILARWAARLWS